MDEGLWGYTEHQNFIKVKNESGSEDVYYSAFCSDLPEEMILKAQKDVNETVEKKVEGLKKLEEFVKKKCLLPVEDYVLISFLRNCKYDIKKSEAKLFEHMKVYEVGVRLLAKYDMKLIETLIDEMAFGILPYRDKEGRVIVCIRTFPRLGFYDTELLDLCCRAAAIYTLSLPMVSLLGVACIVDTQVPTPRMYYAALKFILKVLRNVFKIPLRIARIQVVNDHNLMQLGLKLLRPFIPSKIYDRVTFLGSGSEIFAKFYHPSILPNDFGGELDPLNNKLYRQNMVEKLKSELGRFRY